MSIGPKVHGRQDQTGLKFCLFSFKYDGLVKSLYEAVRECPFAQTLRHTQKNNPRNINYMPVVIFSSIPRF